MLWPLGRRAFVALAVWVRVKATRFVASCLFPGVWFRVVAIIRKGGFDG